MYASIKSMHGLEILPTNSLIEYSYLTDHPLSFKLTSLIKIKAKTFIMTDYFAMPKLIIQYSE